MNYPLVFIVVSALEMLSILLIFVFKDILHSVLALSASLFVAALLFALLGQPLLALLQLFIMVGGISTYLFVGVASVSYSHFKHVSKGVLAFSFLILFAPLAYKAVYSLPTSGGPTSLTPQLISTYLNSGIMAIIIAVLMLFGIGIAAAMAIKRLGAY